MPTILRPIFLLFIAITGFGQAANSKTLTVSSPQEFSSVLRSVKGGDRIELAPGVYGNLTINGRAKLNAPVTITSSNAKKKAVINSLTVNGAENLTFDSLLFDYVYTANDAPHKRTVDLSNTSHITVQNCVFNGDFVRNTGLPENDGYPTGISLYVGESNHISIAGNTFTKFYRGGVFDTVVDLNVSGNEVLEMRAEGFNFSAVKNAVVESNYIHDFLRSVNSPDHPDMIQFWTKNAARPSTEVTIKNNVLDAGTHPWTQSIFMGNEAVLQDGKGKEMFYKNITVTGNVIRNGHIHGITIDAVDGATIENNTLIQINPYAESKNVEVPHVILTTPSRNVTIRRNVLPRIQREYLVKTKGWNIEDNYEAQRSSVGRNNHYLNVFKDVMAKKTLALQDFAVLPTSEIAGKNLGSPLLKFDTYSCGGFWFYQDKGRKPQWH